MRQRYRYDRTHDVRETKFTVAGARPRVPQARYAFVRSRREPLAVTRVRNCYSVGDQRQQQPARRHLPHTGDLGPAGNNAVAAGREYDLGVNCIEIDDAGARLSLDVPQPERLI